MMKSEWPGDLKLNHTNGHAYYMTAYGLVALDNKNHDASELPGAAPLYFFYSGRRDYREVGMHKIFGKPMIQNVI